MSSEVRQLDITDGLARLRAAWRSLFIRNRFFVLLVGLAVASALTYTVPFLFFLPVAGLVLLIGMTAYDGWQLFGRRLKIRVNRRLPKVLSLGDPAQLRLKLGNLSPFALEVTLLDELPFQLQRRDLELQISLTPGERKEISYAIRPLERGSYQFGNVNVFVATALGLLERRLVIEQPEEVPVYPSIIQMNAFSAAADTSVAVAGSRKLRQMGKSYEFDQIKNYVRGDDYRLINWRATGRRNRLMVNLYEDERAQQVYCLVDKSRNMLMPFEGLTLLDYAINATLALSNVILRKHDRAGLITYSDKIGTVLRADGKSTQLQKILQALYREQGRAVEADPELLYYAGRKFVGNRSLLILFSNFSNVYALERALPALRKINNRHLLVVVLFENTEIQQELTHEAVTTEAIYRQSTARHFIYEKKTLAQRLRQFGIQVILTKPANLTSEVIQKYLDLKRKSMI